jgi:hypothetical protein
VPGIFTIGLQLRITALEDSMKRLLVALTAAACAAVAPTLTASAFTPQTTAATRALAWLHIHQQGPDGTIADDPSRTEETVWGLAAINASIGEFSSSAGKTPVDSLRANITKEEATAGNIGSLIMAVAAANLDPTNFAGRNLLQDLVCTYTPTTGAYSPQLFNDALAVLAIPAGKVPTKAVSFLASKQQLDGGWEFSTGSGSDSNTTSLVLLALKSANALTADETVNALKYLKTQQRADSGGFQYQTASYVVDSDPSSDGLVIEALLAAGQDPTSIAWSVSDKNALSDLLSFQLTSGGDKGAFSFTRPTAASPGSADAFSTTQPLVALASAHLPVRAISGTLPSTCPAATATSPTPTLAPTPSPSPTRQLAQTGAPRPSGPPSLLLILGAMVMAFGWRLRRRAH